MSNVVKEDIFDKNPGMGMNANNFEGEITFDLTGPLGSLSGQYYSLMFEMGRRGFAVFKIEESIDVSPVFKQYYDLTIQQKAALEAQVKSGLGQIATAIHDYELISHDLRKYKEYMDYYTKVEQGKELLKKAKTKVDKEQAEQMTKEGMQTLRSVFIDQVDAHTGEGIALRTITPRWPTIIVDFMRLDEKDVDQKKIAEKYGISEAEASVIATKNKLFIEWKDILFKPTLTERYQHILRLVEARKTSVKEYTEMLKPVVARFKIINDALSSGGARAGAWRSFFQPASQAYSMDRTRIWAFLPFAPAEKYKVTRDYLDEIPAKQSGFSKAEIEFIKTQLKKKSESELLNEYESWFVERGTVGALPVEPSIDAIVRNYAPKIETFYQVKITPLDLFNARQRLINLFLRKAMETRGGIAYRRTGEYVAPGVTWQFSPYYVFLDIPFPRTVIRLPNGSELEDVMIENMTVQGRTQNVIIVCLLEVIAREKQLENYISQLVGEMGETGLKIEELAKEQYPEIFGKPSPKAMTGVDIVKGVKQFKWFLGDVMEMIGRKWGIHFDWLRARGPYEFAMDDRIAEMFQLETMMQGYWFVVRYLQKGAGVPGIRV